MKLSCSRNCRLRLARKQDERADDQLAGVERVLHREVRVERDAVQRLPVVLFGPFLMSTPSGLFDPTTCSAKMCSTTSSSTSGRHDHVQREETVQGRIGGQVVAHDPLDQCAADHRNGAEQRDDHLGAPERHLPHGQHVAEERLGHQHEVDQHAGAIIAALHGRT